MFLLINTFLLKFDTTKEIICVKVLLEQIMETLWSAIK